MENVFKLSIKTKAMLRIADTKAYNVRRLFICLAKISRLYHESMHGNCSATLILFKRLRDIVVIDEMLTKQIKHLKFKIANKNPNIMGKTRTNKPILTLNLKFSNSIGYLFINVLDKLETALQLYELAKIIRVYKSQKAIMNKYNKCINIVLELIGNLCNIATKHIKDELVNKELDKAQRSLLRLALNHSAMPDYIRSSHNYYQSKLVKVINKDIKQVKETAV